MTTQEIDKYRHNRKVKSRNFTMPDEDMETIKWIAENQGCSMSEAVRTSVRHYAAMLAFIALQRDTPDLLGE